MDIVVGRKICSNLMLAKDSLSRVVFYSELEPEGIEMNCIILIFYLNYIIIFPMMALRWEKLNESPSPSHMLMMHITAVCRHLEERHLIFALYVGHTDLLIVNSPLKFLSETKEDTVPKKASGGSIDRDIALAEVEKEKRFSFIKAWEDSEKSKAENK
ncbi:hypothetical protein Csa_011018 [Cucumis sativus]|nr:hypothetical protein Csa_011018 [Cucumis sativus]